jgi:hypothetical protein
MGSGEKEWVFSRKTSRKEIALKTSYDCEDVDWVWLLKEADCDIRWTEQSKNSDGLSR